jgi:hypothetical protein
MQTRPITSFLLDGTPAITVKILKDDNILASVDFPSSLV